DRALRRESVQAMNVSQILLRKLLQPNIGALRHHHDGRHPCVVRAEPFVLVQGSLIFGRIKPWPAHTIRPGNVIVVEADVLIAHEAMRLPSGLSFESSRPRRMK